MDAELKRVLGPLLAQKIVGVRVGHILRNERIDTLQQLLSYTKNELLALPNFGPGSLKVLVQTLAESGLELASLPAASDDQVGRIAIELYKRDGGTDWSKASEIAKKCFRRMAVRHRHRVAP
jgi:hypothetical protein